jgi:hypothetical protein
VAKEEALPLPLTILVERVRMRWRQTSTGDGRFTSAIDSTDVRKVQWESATADRPGAGAPDVAS